MTIAVVLTCFNRKDKTLSCLDLIAKQSLPNGIDCPIFLMDDGSSDGTSLAVKDQFPDATILIGDGNLYWCGGMRKAWHAAAKINPDYFLLANDDTLLDSNALSTLLEICPSPTHRTIAVAAIRDPQTGTRTYGGIRGNGTPVDITGKLEPCDTFNANAALIPRAVYAEIGGFHHAYTHALGDFDYGYMASRHGIQILQSKTALGTCSQNGFHGTWRDRSLTKKQRLRLLQSPKGLPFWEWTTFNQRNSGWKWPLISISPTVKILLGK